MPPKQPSYLDLLKGQAEGLLDPNLMIPALGATAVIGGQQIAKRLPGAAEKAAPVVASAAQKAAKTARAAYRTGMPMIDNAISGVRNTITGAKVDFDTKVPRFLNERVEPIAAPVRKVLGKVAGPVGTVTSAIGKVTAPIAKFNSLLYKGAGGAANRFGTAMTMASAAGDPYQADEGIRRTQLSDNIVSRFEKLRDPSFFDKMLAEPNGGEKAEFILTDFKNQLTDAGLPNQAINHILNSMRYGDSIELSDTKSIKEIVNRFMPTAPTYRDKAFAQGSDSFSPMDVLNAATFNIPDIAATGIPALGALATRGQVDLSNPLFDALKNSNSRGDDAIARYNNTKRLEEVDRINQAMNRKINPLSMADAKKQLMAWDAARAKKGF
jgi:hypothetical protein